MNKRYSEFLFLDQFPFIHHISNKKKEIKLEINTSKEVICKRLIYRYHVQIIRCIDMQWFSNTRFLKKKQSTDRNPYITNILHPPRYQ